MGEKFWHHVHVMVNSLIEIAEGVVKFLTFGFIIPGWSFNYIAWYSKRQLRRRMREKGNEGA